MSKFFYSKLALANIKNNKKMIFPYIISSIFITMIYYIMSSLKYNENLTSEVTKRILGFGIYVMAIFIVIFLFYTYSFLIKKRIKELGLYAVLGMTKRHITKVVFLETVIIYTITTFFGIIFGMIFDKLAYLFLIKLIEGNVKLGFNISEVALTTTILFFGVIYFLILLFTVFKIYRLNIINLLKEDKVAEKEPKSRWLLALIGVLFIGYGYYTSLTIKTPLSAITNFFYAVVAVIIGTYLLFIAISIFILKILKNNKNYYYKTKNFISISSMLYRMKRNAVGLASICILSTMSLVTIGSTASLYYGAEDFVKRAFPRDIVTQGYSSNENSQLKLKEITNSILRKNNIEKSNEAFYSFITSSVEKTPQGNLEPVIELKGNLNQVTTLIVISLDDYNKNNNQNETLLENEILIKNLHNKVDDKTFKINNLEYKVKNEIDYIENIGNQIENITDTIYIVVKDKTELTKLESLFLKTIYNEELSVDRRLLQTFYAFDINNNEENTVKKIVEELESSVNSRNGDNDSYSYYHFQDKLSGEKEIRNLYASFMFIGIFISLVFTVSQVMIMYYKQITEGYDDKEKFEIMQKVGLKKKEIKQSIKSQVLIVFFSPLLVALIHLTVAYPFIEKILKVLQLSNTMVFLYAMIITAIIFSIFYFVVYKLTSTIYYKIISNK